MGTYDSCGRKRLRKSAEAPRHVVLSYPRTVTLLQCAVLAEMALSSQFLALFRIFSGGHPFRPGPEQAPNTSASRLG